MAVSRSRERSSIRGGTPEPYSSSSSSEDSEHEHDHRRSRRRRSPSPGENAALRQSRSRSRSNSGSKSSRQTASDRRWSFLNSDSPDRSSRDRGDSPRRNSMPEVNSGRYTGYGTERGRSRLRKAEWPSFLKQNNDGSILSILYISNLNNVVTEKDLSKKFSSYGTVREVCIIKDIRSNESRGIAFVAMEKDEDANAAMEALDHSQWRGRIIFLERC